MNYLVNTNESSSFFSLGATETGRKAYLGDPESIEVGSRPYVLGAHIALRDAIATVAALADDPTRTEVQRHDAAKTVADRTVDRLVKTKADLEARADTLQQEGAAKAESEMRAKLDHGTHDSEVRAWIREQMKSETGIAKVREAMGNSARVAAIVYHSENFLMGMTNDLHQKLKFESVEKHTPDAYQMLRDSVDLRDVAVKYDRAINKVRQTFYNKTIAAQFARRVNV